MNCKYEHTDRTGLYLMVLLTMMASCQTHDRLVDLEKEIKAHHAAQAQVNQRQGGTNYVVEIGAFGE